MPECLREKLVSERTIDPVLAAVIAAWAELPEVAKAGVVGWVELPEALRVGIIALFTPAMSEK